MIRTIIKHRINRPFLDVRIEKSLVFVTDGKPDGVFQKSIIFDFGVGGILEVIVVEDLDRVDADDSRVHHEALESCKVKLLQW